jgi:hypothetical protein
MFTNRLRYLYDVYSKHTVETEMKGVQQVRQASYCFSAAELSGEAFGLSEKVPPS